MKTKFNTIFGAVAGDVIGSVYEWKNMRSLDIPFFNAESNFTDDTVLTIAVADCLLNNKDFSKNLWEYGRKYKGRGYGGSFRKWLHTQNPQPYNSFGNGSAMRVSPVGFAFNTLEEVLDMAKKSAEVTHNHPEGIKGAQVVASSIFLARNGHSQAEIKKYVQNTFEYDLNFTIESIRSHYKFNETCQGSVPQAIVAFLESTNFEHALRLAISVGGDSDTIACITGSIAAAFYKQIPQEIYDFVIPKLPPEFVEILNQFEERFGSS